MEQRACERFLSLLYRALEHINHHYRIISSQIGTIFLSFPLPAKLKAHSSLIPPAVFGFFLILITHSFLQLLRSSSGFLYLFVGFSLLNPVQSYLIFIFRQENRELRSELQYLAGEFALIKSKQSETENGQFADAERLAKLEALVYTEEQQRLDDYKLICDNIRDLQHHRDSILASRLTLSQQMAILLSNIEDLKTATNHNRGQLEQLRKTEHISRQDVVKMNAILQEQLRTAIAGKLKVFQDCLTSSVTSMESAFSNKIEKTYRMMVPVRGRVEALERSVVWLETLVPEIQTKLEDMNAATQISTKALKGSVSKLLLRLAELEIQVGNSKALPGGNANKPESFASLSLSQVAPLIAVMGTLSTRLDCLEHSHTTNNLKAAARDQVIKKIVVTLKKEVNDTKIAIEDRLRHITNTQARLSVDTEAARTEGQRLAKYLAGASEGIEQMSERMAKLEKNLTKGDELSAMRNQLTSLELACDGKFRLVMSTYGNPRVMGMLAPLPQPA